LQQTIFHWKDAIGEGSYYQTPFLYERADWRERRRQSSRSKNIQGIRKTSKPTDRKDAVQRRELRGTSPNGQQTVVREKDWNQKRCRLGGKTIFLLANQEKKPGSWNSGQEGDGQIWKLTT